MQILLILNVKWTRSWPPTARLKVVLIWFKVLSVFTEQWAALLLCKTINIVWLCSMLRGIVCRQCAAALSSQILDSLLVTMSPSAEEIVGGWTTVGWVTQSSQYLSDKTWLERWLHLTVKRRNSENFHWMWRAEAPALYFSLDQKMFSDCNDLGIM